MKLVYKRYASLFFIAGVDGEENELLVLEVLHRYVETLDKYFENVHSHLWGETQAVRLNLLLVIGVRVGFDLQLSKGPLHPR